MRFESILMVRYIPLALSIAVVFAGSLYPFTACVPPQGLGPVAALFGSLMRSPPASDFLLNILFYAPIGFFGSLARNASGATLVPTLLIVATAISTSNELLQYYVCRHPSMFDIGANVMGTFLGILIYMQFRDDSR
jgi:glycopeptide antibiotics resistance protein